MDKDGEELSPLNARADMKCFFLEGTPRVFPFFFFVCFLETFSRRSISWLEQDNSFPEVGAINAAVNLKRLPMLQPSCPLWRKWVQILAHTSFQVTTLKAPECRSHAHVDEELAKLSARWRAISSIICRVSSILFWVCLSTQTLKTFDGGELSLTTDGIAHCCCNTT